MGKYLEIAYRALDEHRAQQREKNQAQEEQSTPEKEGTREQVSQVDEIEDRGPSGEPPASEDPEDSIEPTSKEQNLGLDEANRGTEDEPPDQISEIAEYMLQNKEADQVRGDIRWTDQDRLINNGFFEGLVFTPTNEQVSKAQAKIWFPNRRPNKWWRPPLT